MSIFEMAGFLQAWLAARIPALGNDKGAAAVEYGLLVALIAAVIVGVVGLLGGQVKAAFQTVCTAMKGSAC